MTTLITIIASGLFLGFVSAIPAGPIGVSILSTTAKTSRRYGMMIGFGGAVIDVVYIFLALTGISLISFTGSQVFWLQVIGILFLIYLGVKEFKTPPPQPTNEEPNTPKKRTYFLLGVLLNVSNPAIIASFAAMAAIIKSYELFDDTLVHDAIFAVCMGLGAMLWFWTIAYVMNHYRDVVSDRILRRISVGSGILLLIAAAYLIARLIINSL